MEGKNPHIFHLRGGGRRGEGKERKVFYAQWLTRGGKGGETIEKALLSTKKKGERRAWSHLFRGGENR